MTRLLSAVFILGVALNLGGCSSGFYGFDEFDRYAQRVDAVTDSAGDAKAVNAGTHMITPWPRYVGNRRVPVDGERMVGAVERYRANAQQSSQKQSADAQVKTSEPSPRDSK